MLAISILCSCIKAFVFHILYEYTSFQNDSQFNALYTDYKYPGEITECFVESLRSPLTKENYKSKYHKLLYLEEIESSRKIIQE